MTENTVSEVDPVYIHSVKLTNFKSIGDYSEDEIIIEPGVTAIIGKNESGKSNIINGLSRILFRSINANAFSANIVNRIGKQKTNHYVITLKPSHKEYTELGITEDTVITIFSNQYTAKGGIIKYYLDIAAPSVNHLISELEKISSNPFQVRDSDFTNYKNYLLAMKSTDSLNIPARCSALSFIENHISSLPSASRGIITESLNDVKAVWNQIVNCLPFFFFRNADKHLNERYKYDEIEKELKSPRSYPNSLLSDFVKTLDVPVDDFLSASKSGSSPSQITIRKRIERKINERINSTFHQFYNTEKVELEIGFNSGEVVFSVISNSGESMALFERSNGLRWYLDTYIDILANDLPTRNVVFLLDEPGTSLHVNAQRELLQFFHHLAANGNQVVYSTHSPFMLDTDQDGLHRIRAVVKDAAGYSRIFKTAYDSRISPDSQNDTLTPIITALGMNLNCTFGPAHNKLNIVIEGMSDYIFLQTMAKICNLDMERFTFIPSIGASNCINICTILHGWGCPYFVVFDYDTAGVETGGEVLRNDFLCEYKRDYCFLADVSQETIDQRTYKTDKCLIEDIVTQEEIERYCSESNRPTSLNKALLAKLMCNASETGTFVFSESVIQNFRTLFNRITEYASAKLS